MSGSLRRVLVSAVARNLGSVHKWGQDRAMLAGANAMQQRSLMTSPELRQSTTVPATPSWLTGGSLSASIPPNTKPEILITCVGPHQAGVVASLSKVISEHGGHITQSKTMELGLQFCLMASVWVGDPDKAGKLRLSLNDLADNKMVCAIGTGWIPDTLNEKMIKYTACQFKLSGRQQLGQMAKFSDSLASMGIQLADMNHITFPGAGGETQIAWEGTLQIPEDISLATIHEQVAILAKTVGLSGTTSAANSP